MSNTPAPADPSVEQIIHDVIEIGDDERLWHVAWACDLGLLVDVLYPVLGTEHN